MKQAATIETDPPPLLNKDLESQEIERQIAEFLASGKKITKCTTARSIYEYERNSIMYNNKMPSRTKKRMIKALNKKHRELK